MFIWKRKIHGSSFVREIRSLTPPTVFLSLFLFFSGLPGRPCSSQSCFQCLSARAQVSFNVQARERELISVWAREPNFSYVRGAWILHSRPFPCIPHVTFRILRAVSSWFIALWVLRASAFVFAVDLAPTLASCWFVSSSALASAVFDSAAADLLLLLPFYFWCLSLVFLVLLCCFSFFCWLVSSAALASATLASVALHV